MVESNQTQQMVKDLQPQTLFVFVSSEQLMKRFLLCFSSSENHRSRPREAEEQKIEYIVTLHAWTGVLSCCSFINSAAAWKCVTEIQWKERGFFLWLLFPWSTWAALHVFEILCTFCCSRILLPLRSSRWWIAVLPLKPGLPRSYLLPLALHVKKHFNINKSQLGMLSFFSTHEEWRNGIFSISMLYLLANAPRIKEKKREQIILPYNCDNGKKNEEKFIMLSILCTKVHRGNHHRS